MDLAGEMPLAALGHSDQLNPWVIGGILLHNFVGAIGLTVADDHPFDRPDGLSHHGQYRQLNELCLIPSRSNQNVRRERRHSHAMRIEAKCCDWGEFLSPKSTKASQFMRCIAALQ